MKKYGFYGMLAAAALLAVFASCGNEEGIDPAHTETETGSAQTVFSESTAEEEAYPLPDSDFGGAEFHILTDDYLECEIIAEDSGDIVDTAVYARNLAVQEKYDFVLTEEAMVWQDVPDRMSTLILAGEDAVQLLSHHMISAGTFAAGGLYENWYEIPYIDFSAPWWSASMRHDLTLNGRAYIAVGDLSLTTTGRIFCLFFDKKGAQNHDLPDLYQTVEDGAWTFEFYSSLIKDLWEDINGNDKAEFSDYYGMVMDSMSLTVWRWAFDAPIIETPTIPLQITIDNERMQRVSEGLYSLCYDNPGVYYRSDYQNPNSRAGSSNRASRDAFVNGTSLFAIGVVEMAIKDFREIGDYGLLPLPKLDAAQEAYHTIADGGNAGLLIPKTVSDPERAGVIIEALARENNRSVLPVYYESALKVKYTRDAESVRMLDLIRSGAVYDFGYTYDGWNGIAFTMQSMISSGSSAWSSTAASLENKVKQYYAQLEESFVNQ